jgi:hypothetical protein
MKCPKCKKESMFGEEDYEKEYYWCEFCDIDFYYDKYKHKIYEDK